MCVLILWNLKVQYDPIWLYILSCWVQKYLWLQFNIFVELMEYMQMLRGGVKCTPPACTCQPGTVLSVHVNSTWWTRYISAPYRALEQCSEKVQLQSTAVWLLGDWGYREREYIEFNNHHHHHHHHQNQNHHHQQQQQQHTMWDVVTYTHSQVTPPHPMWA